MASYLITGASRGIGLELTKQLLELPASQVGKVFAVTRSDPSAPLRNLLDKKSVQRAAQDVKAQLGAEGLDVLVNDAGGQAFSPGCTKTAPPEQLAHLFDVNVVGTHRVTAAFLPLLEVGNQKKVINVSSTMGSISWAPKFKLAPSPAYKVFKAALHMLNMQYALDLADAGFTFLCVSPGWLKTDPGGEHADFDVEIGVTELKRIILESGKAQNGKFLNIHVPGQEKAWGQYDGGEITW